MRSPFFIDARASLAVSLYGSVIFMSMCYGCEDISKLVEQVRLVLEGPKLPLARYDLDKTIYESQLTLKCNLIEQNR